MKYDQDTPLGLDWAGLVEVRRAYDWDPAHLITGVPEEAVAGVEAPLWTETLRHADIDFMAFPRLPGIAEIGWSPATARSGRTSGSGSPPRAALDRGRHRLLPLPADPLAHVT